MFRNCVDGRLKRQLTNIIKKRRHWSFQMVLSLSFTVIAIFAMLFVGLSLYFQFTDTSRRMVEEDNRRVIDQVNLNLDWYLRNLMRISDTMYYNVIKNHDISDDALNIPLNLLYESSREPLVSIALFDQEGNLIASSPYSKLKPELQITRQNWYRQAIYKIEDFAFTGPHVQNIFADPDDRYRWVISLSRYVELTENGSVKHGVLLVDMNYSMIEQICRNVNLGESGYMYLISNEGELIYHPRSHLLMENIEKENNYQAATYEDGSHFEVFNNQQRLVTVKTAGYTGWKLIGVTPMESVTADYRQVSMLAIISMFFAAVLLAGTNAFVSKKIANPIKKLENSVRKLENGEKEIVIPISGSHEVRHLGQAIEAMVDQMHKLMDEIIIEQEAKKKSELDALQSQINPHFLYNTLDSIIWMIENRKYEGSIIMVSAMARLFRISISRGQNVITVANELEHARSYLIIQQTRYKNRFTFNITADPEVYNLAVIKLIVQPLIENSIYHGMEFMSGDGEIDVKAYLSNGNLCIDVTDNGLGIPDEDLKNLLTDQTRERGKGSGIGLANVNERIQLYFGSEYGLSIISEPDIGTTIKLKMPQIKYTDWKEKK